VDERPAAPQRRAGRPRHSARAVPRPRHGASGHRPAGSGRGSAAGDRVVQRGPAAREPSGRPPGQHPASFAGLRSTWPLMPYESRSHSASASPRCWSANSTASLLGVCRIVPVGADGAGAGIDRKPALTLREPGVARRPGNVGALRGELGRRSLTHRTLPAVAIPPLPIVADALLRTRRTASGSGGGNRARAATRHGEAQQNPRVAGVCEEPTAGLEPATPSLRVKCSTS